ncbi:MAG: VWA domain-containing protein [Verrucomicrobiota bacterium]
MLVFDCSQSMLARDISPSRLEHARWIARQLIKEFRGDRFGIVTFAGDAFLECPLTNDTTTLLSFLREISTDSIPVSGTNIESALKTAREALKKVKGQDHAIVLLTDGEELEGDVQQEISALVEENIPVIATGVGSNEAVPIKKPDGEYIRDAEGEIVTTRLESEVLESLARGTDGQFIESTTRETGLDWIMTHLEQIIPEEGQKQEKMVPMERFQIPLAIAFFLLLTRLLVGERRLKKTRKDFPLLILTALFISAGGNPVNSSMDVSTADARNGRSTAAREETPNKTEGNTYTEGDNAGAKDQLQYERRLTESDKHELEEQLATYKKRLKNSAEKYPLRLLFNIGRLYQHLGKPEKAEEHYRQIISQRDKDDNHQLPVAWSYWNLGVLKYNAAAQQAKTEPAESLDTIEEVVYLYREGLMLVAEVKELREEGRKEIVRQLAVNLECALNLQKQIEDFLNAERILEKLRQDALAQANRALIKQRGIPLQKNFSSFSEQVAKTEKETQSSKFFIHRLASFLTLLEQRFGKNDQTLQQRAHEAHRKTMQALEKQRKLLAGKIATNNVARNLNETEQHLAAALELLKDPSTEEQDDEKQPEQDDKGKQDDRPGEEKSGSEEPEDDQDAPEDASDASREPGDGEDDNGTGQETDKNNGEPQDDDQESPDTTTAGDEKKQRLEDEQAESLLQQMGEYEGNFQQFLKQYRFKGKDDEGEKSW